METCLSGLPRAASRASCMLFVVVAEASTRCLWGPHPTPPANCESMLIVFISIPFYDDRIVMNCIECEAASSAGGCRPGREPAHSPHIPSAEYLLVSVLFCNTSVKPAALLYFFNLYLLSRWGSPVLYLFEG